MRKNSTMLEPQINFARSTRWRMWMISFCAGAVVIQSALTDSFASLGVAIAALIGAVATEGLVNIKTGVTSTIKDGSAVTTAFIMTLLLPNAIHPFLAFLGAVFAIAVVKYSFGGLGSNWLNPALGGWFFVWLAWPGIFNGSLDGSVLQTLNLSHDPLGSPMEIVRFAGIDGGLPDAKITGILNSSVFSLFGITLPDGYVNLFSLAENGIIADRGVLALFIGTMLITASRISRFWTPGLFLGVYTILVYIFGSLPFGGLLNNGDMLFGLCTGGTLVAAFILLSDPVTGPKSNAGAAVAAVLAGIMAFVFRYPGREAMGAIISVAVINSLVPLIRGIEDRFFFVKRSTSL